MVQSEVTASADDEAPMAPLLSYNAERLECPLFRELAHAFLDRPNRILAAGYFLLCWYSSDRFSTALKCDLIFQPKAFALAVMQRHGRDLVRRGNNSNHHCSCRYVTFVSENLPFCSRGVSLDLWLELVPPAAGTLGLALAVASYGAGGAAASRSRLIDLYIQVSRQIFCSAVSSVSLRSRWP